MSRTDTILKLEGVSKHYGGVRALSGIELSIERGEFLTLLGPSGSGKSTMLMLIAGFEPPTEGDIFLDGESLNGVPAYKRRIGVVFQNYALFPHLTVFENIAFSLRNLRWAKTEIKERVEEMIGLVRLDGLGERMPEELSGGQQQRVAMARALAFRPKVLLLDEPLGALDRKLREHMHVELRNIHRKLETTLIYVTHDQEEAMVMSDRIAVMNEGRVVRVDTPRALYEDPQLLFVADFIGESTIIAATTRGVGLARVDGATDQVRISHNFRKDTRIRLAIRPENARLGAPRKGENSIPGTIEEVLYGGDVTKVILQLDTGGLAMVKQMTNEETDRWEPGARIAFTWRREDGHLLLDD